MNSRDHEPLNPDERDLAQRLSRLGGHSAPSPALDARILAAARDAVQAPSRPSRPRWPFGVGIAASLAIAVGVAWQLRPLPESEVLQAPSETTATRMVAEPALRSAAPASAIEDAAAAPVAREAGTTGVETPEAAVDIAEPVAERAPRAPRPAQAGDAPVAAQEPAAARIPAVAPATPPPAPAPPAPPASPAPAAPMSAPVPQEAAAPKTLLEDRERQAQPAPSAASMRTGAARTDESGLDRITVTGSRVRRAEPVAADRLDEYLDEPMDDEPPVSFASPQARDAWLQRIRELADEGDHDAARASLREFRRRYPQHPVPADLKALLEE